MSRSLQPTSGAKFGEILTKEELVEFEVAFVCIITIVLITRCMFFRSSGKMTILLDAFEWQLSQGEVARNMCWPWRSSHNIQMPALIGL